MAHRDPPEDHRRAAGAALMAGGVFGVLALGFYWISRKRANAEKPGELYVHQTQAPPPSIAWHQPGWKPPAEPKGPFKPHA